MCLYGRVTELSVYIVGSLLFIVHQSSLAVPVFASPAAQLNPD